MTLKTLSNDLLEARLKKLVSTERKITHLVLQYIAEIDHRKLYVQRAYPSLFEFMVKEHGYSAAAAMRRIEGARLLMQIPELSEKLENGALNLSQVALIQRAEREYKKETKLSLPIETKRELLSRIENQTQANSEALISQELDITFVAKNKLTHHKDESVTLAITLTKKQVTALEQVQAMLSHAVPEKNWASLISYLAQKEISRRIGSNTPQPEIKAPRPNAKAFISVAETNTSDSRVIPCSAKNSLRQRKAIGRNLKRQLLLIRRKLTKEKTFCHEEIKKNKFKVNFD